MNEVKRLKDIKEKIEKMKKGEIVDDESPSPLVEAESPSVEETILDVQEI